MPRSVLLTDRLTANRRLPLVSLTVFASMLLTSVLPAAEPSQFRFSSTAEKAGLFPALEGIQGHAAGWGDVDGNGWPDLYVGTFHSKGEPNVLLLNDNGKFRVSSEESVRISTRATGGLLVDLDNDGDLDLYVSSMPAAEGGGLAKRLGYPLAGCSLFRNEGKGQFTEISAGNGACPAGFGGRSACVLDYDGDGLLDLLVGEDPLPGYNGSETKSSRLFRNLGDLQFEDVSRKVGLPEGIPGLGVAAGDVNNDGWPDFFLASNRGGNRLFLNDGKGRFRESPGSQQLFDWPTATGDNMVCGVCLGDVNRDGLLDIVLGQHYKQPWREPVANRLYLNRGVKQGVPQYDDVTEEVGLVPLPMKAPHVELQDFDNDGWPDLLTSLVMYDGDQPHPVIFRHTGLKNGLPVFRQDALGANDFPTAADRAEKNTGKFFAKMIEEGKVIYGAPMPSADYNRDGRIDLFLANWWVERPSLLLRNETEGGHWLDVLVQGTGDVNRMGIGSRIEIYQPGQLGQADGLVGCREIAVGFGYASAQEAVAHFGLGELKTCDVRVILPHGAGTIEKKNVEAGQRVTLSR